MNDDMNWLPWTARAYRWCERKDVKGVAITVGIALLPAVTMIIKYCR